MRARIVTATAIAFGLCLAIVPAAAAEDCTLADKTLNECEQPAPQPEPEPQPQPQQPQPQPSQQSAQVGHVPEAVSRILVLMNDERRSRGLPLFSQRGDVSAISRDHSKAMAATGTIYHNDAYFTPATKNRLDAALLGENVARNADIDDAHRRLMNSPGHRANLLDARFTVVGLGVYRSSTGSLYVTQNFVQPVARATAPAARADKARNAAAPKAATAAAPTTTSTPAPAPGTSTVPPTVEVPAAATEAGGPELLAAPLGLPGAPESRPVGAMAAAAMLALLSAAAVLVHRFRSRFAPFARRTGR